MTMLITDQAKFQPALRDEEWQFLAALDSSALGGKLTLKTKFQTTKHAKNEQLTMQ